MLLSEMIKTCQELQDLHGDLEMSILDDFTGGGVPRTINSKPCVLNIDDLKNYFFDNGYGIDKINDFLEDVETKSGKIIIMGY